MVKNIKLDGGDCGYAIGINDGSYVVGAANYGAAQPVHAFLWDPTTEVRRNLTDLTDPMEFRSQARSINIHGKVAGEINVYTTPAAPKKACIFELHQAPVYLTPKDDITEVHTGYATSINDGGLVAGANRSTPVIWDNGVMQALIPEATSGGAFAVNKAGEVVGYYTYYATELSEELTTASSGIH